MDVRIHTLENGLTVYITRNDLEPRVYTEIAVRAGSKHDPPETTGLAHYLEHLLFKGTDRIGTVDYAREKVHLDRIDALYEQRFAETDPAKRTALFREIGEETLKAAQYAVPNELDRFYSAIGGRHVNAHTSHEETVYKVGVPANRFEQWARVEAERFRKPVLRLFQPELEVVYEEKNRSLDDKFTLLWEAVNRKLFPAHAYGQQTTIGEAEHLKNPSLENIYRYYQRHYVPANMAIFMSGDIDPDEAIRVIEKHFGSWEPGPVPEAPKWDARGPQGVERVEVDYPGEEFVLLGFRTASAASEDAEALKLVDMILDNSTAGLINLNLNQRQKVRRAGSFPMLLNEAGLQFMWGIPNQGQSLDAVEKLLLAQIEQIKRGEFDESILAAIVLDYRKNEARKLEDNQARVSLMRQAFLGFREWEDFAAEIDRMKKVTKADVVRVANAYFQGNYVSGFRRDGKHEVPSIEKPKMPAIPIDPSRQSDFMKNLLAQDVPSIAPKYIAAGRDYQSTVVGGLDVRTAKNTINDLFSLTISLPVGYRQDPRLPLAQRLLAKSGAGTRSAEETAVAWYRLGTSFDMEVDASETRIRLSGLDENFDASLALADDLLRRTNASPETLAMLVKILAAQRADSRKDQKVVEQALQYFNRYGDQSIFVSRLPVATLAKLTTDDLTGALGSALEFRHRIGYVGPRSLEAVVEALKAHHDPASASKTAPEPTPLRVATPEKTLIRFVHMPMAQALVRIEQADGTYDAALTPEVELYNNYFAGGMNGIVFQELRESRALAYTAQARYLVPERAGRQNIMHGRIGTQADKTVEAVTAFLELLDALPRSEERFAPAAEGVINQYETTRIGFREVLGKVVEWERLGLAPDPRRDWYARVKTLGLDDVVAFHKRRLAGKPKLISIVGDKAKIDLEALQKLGTVIEVTPEQIISL